MTLVVLFSFIFFLYDQSLHFTRSTTGKSASILYIQQKFRTSLPKKIEVNTCFEDGQKVRNDN